MTLPPFHLAFPVDDLAAARGFYGELLGCPEGRSADQWIDFDLEGTTSNRSAIGAEVRLFWNGQKQVQQVSGGSGFCAQNQRRLHFGIGRDPRLEKAEIRWPSGQVQTITDLVAGQTNKIKEPS